MVPNLNIESLLAIIRKEGGEDNSQPYFSQLTISYYFYFVVTAYY